MDGLRCISGVREGEAGEASGSSDRSGMEENRAGEANRATRKRDSATPAAVKGGVKKKLRLGQADGQDVRAQRKPRKQKHNRDSTNPQHNGSGKREVACNLTDKAAVDATGALDDACADKMDIHRPGDSTTGAKEDISASRHGPEIPASQAPSLQPLDQPDDRPDEASVVGSGRQAAQGTKEYREGSAFRVRQDDMVEVKEQPMADSEAEALDHLGRSPFQHCR